MTASGMSAWDAETTAQIIAVRAVKPRVGEGAYSLIVTDAPRCGATLECGGECALAAEHVGACECCGDQPGEPGSCSA